MKKLMMVVMVVGMAAAAWADVSFSYSGQLRSETGEAVSMKNAKITFSLYNVATDGAALWSRMVAVLLDDNGYFAVELSNAVGSPVGAETQLETVLANNATLYIGLNVDGSSGEILPRQKLLSTPRAAFAEDVNTAKNSFTVKGEAVLVSGLKIGSLDNPKAEIKKDGEIVAQRLTASTGISTLGYVSMSTLDAKNVKQDGYTLIPPGVIVMWSGTTAPAGWALCNGEKGTPDLRGRFVIGTGKSSVSGTTYEYGATGGEETHTLTVDEMPAHSHSIIYRITDLISHDGGTYVWAKSDDRVQSTGSVGGSKAHENRPPYYALAYIMKL